MSEKTDLEKVVKLLKSKSKIKIIEKISYKVNYFLRVLYYGLKIAIKVLFLRILKRI